MYLYGFTTFAGIDKVMKYYGSDFPFAVGDLLESDGDYFLVLGGEVSFSEQYGTWFPNERHLSLVYSGFFSGRHLDLLHWMVAEYYTSYKNVMKYFVNQDVMSLLEKGDQKKPVKLKSLVLNPSDLGVDALESQGQVLIVYPDLRTMQMMVVPSVRETPGVLKLSSSDTQVKKDKAYWQVKQGLVKYVLVTHAELFQDFKDLKQVILVHPYKRYYANQQDPRYKTPDVLAHLAEMRNISVQMKN